MGIYEAEEAESARDAETMLGLLREFRAAGLPLNVHSNVYENARQVKGGPGYLVGFTVYNSLGSGQFIQWHDSAVLPANGAVPEGVIDIATVVAKGVQFLPLGRAFQRGIYLVNSTTAPTLTLGAANCFFDAQYL